MPHVWEPDTDASESILAGLRASWAAARAGNEAESRRIIDELHAWYGYEAVSGVMLAEISSGRNRHIEEEQ